FVVNKGKFTKHYFEGTSRIVSKLGEGTFHQPTGLTAGSIDYIKQSAKIQEAIDQYIKGLNIPPGPPTQHGIYGTPDFTGQEYPSIDWSDISQDQEPPEGWPRPPKFNEPGDVPGPPVQYGDPVKPDNVKGGFGYVDNGIEEKNLYFYHPDHLGSSSYITDKDGNINQHTEYMAFGEVLFDEHKVSRRMPYLFNGKELDSETGLYYYGARYYDARVSLWLGTDPLSGYNPIMEIEHYIDGEHNGGVFNPMNFATYSYTYQNPILYIDPNGKQVQFDVGGYLQGQFDALGAEIDRKIKYASKKIIDMFNVEVGASAGIGLGFKATKYAVGKLDLELAGIKGGVSSKGIDVGMNVVKIKGEAKIGGKGGLDLLVSLDGAKVDFSNVQNIIKLESPDFDKFTFGSVEGKAKFMSLFEGTGSAWLIQNNKGEWSALSGTTKLKTKSDVFSKSDIAAELKVGVKVSIGVNITQLFEK
ncbi:RHS repeat domain-containing protein, partial [Bergeyella sp. RCAD1439]|uniref:RHS repeat domain-containing protein n=1 Tax=Bergeyella anatis TaxID=3113737 RepID=UPI002E16F26F|nr:RHS repeat-associated core domain-containing protein [Bergeyella sp. RCAD1439]